MLTVVPFSLKLWLCLSTSYQLDSQSRTEQWESANPPPPRGHHMCGLHRWITGPSPGAGHHGQAARYVQACRYGRISCTGTAAWRGSYEGSALGVPFCLETAWKHLGQESCEFAYTVYLHTCAVVLMRNAHTKYDHYTVLYLDLFFLQIISCQRARKVKAR